MSSSAPRRQMLPEIAAPFPYPDAGAAVPNQAGKNVVDRSQQIQAEFFEQGRQSAQQHFRSELNVSLGKNREQITQALQHFALERQNYYRRIEGEVVQLAIAIARKVLHREVQIDPQTLAGIVRVTLEKLDTATKVNLSVNPREAADWRHYFACRMDEAPAPDIHEDAGVALGECRIETSLGSTEVGLESQLKEIETGLFDLLAERPDAAASSPVKP